MPKISVGVHIGKGLIRTIIDGLFQLKDSNGLILRDKSGRRLLVKK